MSVESISCIKDIVHVQRGDGLFRYLVTKFNREIEVLYKVNQVNREAGYNSSKWRR